MSFSKPDVSEILGDLPDLEVDPWVFDHHRPRYNLAPGQGHMLVRAAEGAIRLSPALWGLRRRAGGLHINARQETASQLPPFRGAWQARRCLIPADAFYEWKADEKGARLPFRFHRPDNGVLWMAGIFDEEPEAEEGKKLRFTVMTTSPNQVVARYHDRMPVIFGPADGRAWLSQPLRDLRPAPDDLLVAHQASTRLNKVANDDPDVLVPDASPEEAPGAQLSLL